MKTNHKKVLFIASTLALLSFNQSAILALTDAKTIKSKAISGHTKKDKALNETSEDDAPTKPSPAQDKLAQVAQAYQDNPDDNTYNDLWSRLVAFVEQSDAKHKDPAYLFKSWKALSQAGLKVIEPNGANSATHIYVFNHMPNNSFVPQSKSALIQWADQSAIASTAETSRKEIRKWHPKKVKTVSSIKTQYLTLPSSVDIKEASLFPNVVAVAKTTVAKKTKKGVAKVKVAKVVISGGRYLAVSGTDTQSGHTWVLGLKQSAGSWVNSADIFQDVPTFLVQSSSAKARFSSNNLVVSIGGVGGYELVMPFVEDHFAFSTKEAQDSASAVAHQFLMALQYKRMDLAKVWLADPKLASIPGYLGLFNRDNDSPPLRLANMPQPICGGSRFRLITNGKDDLIIDVSKIKTQLLIKAVFIAPAVPQSSLISKTSPN